MSAYTKQTRLGWARDNLPRIESTALSYRDIALELKHQFGLDRPPSPATIGRLMKEVRDEGPDKYSKEAERLLEPENFPEFRLLFNAPDGQSYETTLTHHALYWMLYSLALKVDLPEWVITFWHLPADVNEDIIEREKLLTFILLVAPRHGKTMTILHGLIALIAINPNVRIMYCQGIKETSEKAMAMVMAELEYNKGLLALFGPFRDEDRKWSTKNGFIVLRRDIQAISDTFTPIGINSNIRSLDADIIIIDDPQDLERAESEATTRKDFNKITTEIMTRREPHTPVLGVGSHVQSLIGDVWTQIEDKIDDLQTDGQTVIMRKRPAHDLEVCEGREPHYECLEWPERRNWGFLMAQKSLLGADMFEAVYQQEARIKGTRPFTPDVIKTYRQEGGILDPLRSWKVSLDRCLTMDGDKQCTGTLYTTLGFDPAAGETKKASFSALSIVTGCIKCKTIYYVDFWQKRQSPELHAQLIVDYASSFDVDYVKVEINAYQKALARDSVLRDGAREFRFTIDEHTTDDKKNTSTFGIPNVARYVNDGLFSMPAMTQLDVEYGKEARDALIRYPGKPTDIPMSLWLACTMLWEVWALYAHAEPIAVPHLEEMVPQYMLDDPLIVTMADVRE